MLTQLALTCALVMTGQTQGDTAYTSQRTFQIPAKIDPTRRDQMKEIQLYVSADRGKSWGRTAKITPDKTAFDLTVPSDGEYWYHICIVNQQGKQDPPEVALYSLPPLLKLVVDTRPPELQITSATRQGDELVVSWLAREDNPDVASLTVEYRALDGQTWVAVPIPAQERNATGTVRAKVAATGPVVVKLSLADLAKNSKSVEKRVEAAAGSSVAGSGAVLPPPPLAANDLQKTAASSPIIDPPPPVGMDKTVIPPPPGNPGATEQSSITLAGQQVVAKSQGFTDNSQGSAVPQPPAATTQRKLPPLQIVNDPEIVLEYEVSKVGPSGLGAVQVWITRDNGNKWEPYMEDPNASQATAGSKYQRTLTLPGEGVFGISLVVKSKVGLGKPAPKSGDVPEMLVEVDTTPPSATVYKPMPDGTRRDTLILSWTATDRNLGPRPITLEWAERPTGPWNVIAAEVPNSGQYTWKLPPSLPSHVHLKLTVHDTAGNVAVAITDEPQLVDLSEPEGHLIMVRPAKKQ
jgi:hypothetical protein